MHFRLIILIALIVNCSISFAQQNQTLFSIEGDNVSLNEFKRAFTKTNQEKLSNNKEFTRDFLNQYIGLKLKVKEARKLNLDRDKEFKERIEYYKKSIAKKYITDKETVSRLANQVYQRMKTEIKIKHILIRVHRYAAPKDTLIAYKKALAIRKELVNSKNFGELSKEASDAPGAAINKGELGYISAFKLPYPIESYIFNTNSDKYSLPLRSHEGYHIIKVIKKRPSSGYLKVAHIMLVHSRDTSIIAKDNVKNRINDIYRKLVAGEDFNQLAQKYSEDISCSKKGAELPWFTTGQMPEVFEEACLNISIGKFSKPIQTRFGWHIIKKTEQKELPSYSEIKQQIENLVMHNRRGQIAQNKALKKIKKNCKFKDFQTLSPVWKMVDSTIFDAKWLAVSNEIDLKEKLFEFNNRAYFQKDFVNELKTNQEITFPIPIKNYIYLRYRNFVNKMLLDFEMGQIENKNSEVEYLLKDYEETVLANKVMEAKVWSKLANDQSGLQSYYNKNKERYNNNYQVDVTIFKFTENIRKIEKQLRKLKKKSTSDKEIVVKIKANTDNNFDLVEKAIKEEGKHTLTDKVIDRYKSGNLSKFDKLIIFENDKRIIWLNSTISKTNKSLNEFRDEVEEDYKLHFEKNWINQLKRKMKVEINEEVFESIFQN